MILDVLEQRLGAISDFSPLAEGLASQAFGFRQAASNYVVRVNRSSDGFAKDQFVYRTFASSDLPIPEVLDIGYLDDQHFFCVSRRMPGIRLQDTEACHMEQLVTPILRVMETIAARDISGTVGFGRFNIAGKGPYARWHDFLVSVLDADRYDWGQAGRTLHMPTIRTLWRLLADLARECPEERHLIHGDFGSYNMLADADGISAVIDWDRALFGDPLYDVANLLFWQEERLQPLIERIQKQDHTIPRWAERVLCYQLRIGLEEIYDSATGAGTIHAAWLADRCQAIVEQRTVLETNR
ncbi:MAG TPA: aminoglycoside phosphotransferase family protein [Terrimicrobiaceae bacterium]